MGAFLGISVWVALATVVPGLITIACMYGAISVVNPSMLAALTDSGGANDWVWAGYAVAAMVLTQALGILLEGMLISKRWLGPETLELDIPQGIDPKGETHIVLRPYFEYEGIYLLLSELTEHEDSQGHMKRALAQFFLTNNTLVSYFIGIVVAFAALLSSSLPDALNLCAIYASGLVVCLLLSFKVAVIRFQVMAKSLWAARRRRFTSTSATG